MTIRYTRRARRDLVEILAYVSIRSPQGAAGVAEALEKTVQFLADNPKGGMPTQKHALFVKIVPDRPYRIFYRLAGDGLEIVHIRHAARRPWAI